MIQLLQKTKTTIINQATKTQYMEMIKNKIIIMYKRKFKIYSYHLT
jgi:hypothetical protein